MFILYTYLNLLILKINIVKSQIIIIKKKHCDNNNNIVEMDLESNFIKSYFIMQLFIISIIHNF